MNSIGSPSMLDLDCVYSFLSHMLLVAVGLLWLLELMRVPLGKMELEEEVKPIPFKIVIQM